MKNQKKKKINKLGISEMLSYVILVSITLAVSVAVYAFIMVYAKYAPPIDCKDETSVIINDYKCLQDGIDLYIENNGNFKLDGVTVMVGESASKTPTFLLVKKGDTSTSMNGNFYFVPEALKPGDVKKVSFSNKVDATNKISKIEIIQIQPFIMSKRNKVVCTNAVIHEEVKNCIFT